MPILDALTSVEEAMMAAMFAAAVVLALWSAREGANAATSRVTGEVLWSVVAVAMLAVVSVAVGLGGASAS